MPEYKDPNDEREHNRLLATFGEDKPSRPGHEVLITLNDCPGPDEPWTLKQDARLVATISSLHAQVERSMRLLDAMGDANLLSNEAILTRIILTGLTSSAPISNEPNLRQLADYVLHPGRATAAEPLTRVQRIDYVGWLTACSAAVQLLNRLAPMEATCKSDFGGGDLRRQRLYYSGANAIAQLWMGLASFDEVSTGVVLGPKDTQND